MNTAETIQLLKDISDECAKYVMAQDCRKIIQEHIKRLELNDKSGESA